MGEELWYVKVADDDVHRMTLDQLDGAFQAGHIDESTMVLAADATKWARLGELLGLDEGTEEAPYPPPQGSRAHAAPVAFVTAPPVAVTRAATAPMGYPASIAPAPAFMPNSLRPMSLDLEDGEFDAPFRRKSRKGWVVAVIGIAAVAGGVGFAATRARASSNDIASTAAAAAKAVPPPAANPEPVPAPAPPPPSPAMATNPGSPTTNASLAGVSPMSPHFTDRFNEDPKLKLIAAEKEHEQKAKGRHSGGGGAASHGATKSKSTTFTTGGNKFDPLNSSI
jgi:hypothetical protein